MLKRPHLVYWTYLVLPKNLQLDESGSALFLGPTRDFTSWDLKGSPAGLSALAAFQQQKARPVYLQQRGCGKGYLRSENDLHGLHYLNSLQDLKASNYLSQTREVTQE